jgi:hypothetical protein
MTTATKTPAPQTYLMWIGKEHYPTIADYVKEASEQGISKRVATADLAQKLSEPGTLVFLAHDEGMYDECSVCLGDIENPDYRKTEQEFQRAQTTWENRKRDLTEIKATLARKPPRSPEETTMAEASVQRAEKLKDNAFKKAAQLEHDLALMPKTVKAGTGGKVTLNNGETWDYRRYMYWRNQPKKWDFRKEVKSAEMCAHCGGFGKLPLGKVFGVFLPQAAEYILKAEDGDKVKDELSAKGIGLITTKTLQEEPARGCGKRRPGGYYLVTKTTGTEATQEQVQQAVDQLVKAGVVDPAEVKVSGSFAEFMSPVDITEKRFRGVKRWEPVGAAAEEAADIADAAADEDEDEEAVA